MNIFEQEFRKGIDQAVRDLFSDKDKYHYLDIDVVANTVTDFVLTRENLAGINEANQYEAYYQVLGKAVAITQGWKLNSAAEVKLPSQTENNLKDYMQKTYGIRTADA